METSEFERMAGERLGQVFEFRQTLSSETDRGCALMAAAYLDDQLQELLLQSFVDDDATSTRFFHPNGPLGSFSARIDLAFLLGLISKQALRDLHLIRKIRNEFGHNHRPMSFSAEAVTGRCRELLHTPLLSSEPARRRFENAVLGVLAVIHFSTGVAKENRPASPPDLDLSEARKAAMRTESERAVEFLMKKLEEFRRDSVENGSSRSTDATHQT